ncbi:MAG: hypothetical protein IJ708_06220 [Clostridia bacterium]|nr:hypothetical protein [Clostridia bacterium]
MKGKHSISITSRKATYHLELERKITVLKGNSGTGKSSLIRLVSEYLEYGKQSGIKLTTDTSVSLSVLTNHSDWEEMLSSVHDTLLFIDEDVRFLYSVTFQKQLWKADCYAVIVSRSGRFTALPYSIFGIYELVTVKKETNTATTLYRLYEERYDRGHFDLLLTEDSNSGFEMAKFAFENAEVISAGGNASVITELLKQSHVYHRICVNVDGAAFGAFIEPVLKYAETRGNIWISGPESFEYVLLNLNEIRRRLSSGQGEITRTYDFCDSSEYGSWEQYYEDLLKEITAKHLGFTYNKRKLNQWFLNRNCVNQYVDMLQKCFVARREAGGEE